MFRAVFHSLGCALGVLPTFFGVPPHLEVLGFASTLRGVPLGDLVPDLDRPERLGRNVKQASHFRLLGPWIFDLGRGAELDPVLGWIFHFVNSLVVDDQVAFAVMSPDHVLRLCKPTSRHVGE